MNVLVREYEKCDAEQISNIIGRNKYSISESDYVIDLSSWFQNGTTQETVFIRFM